MNTPVSVLVAAVVLFIGMGQAIDPTTDPDYQLFAMTLASEQQAAEEKLNIAKETYENITISPNTLESEEINTTLYVCFDEVKAKYPQAQSFCMESVEQEVEQMVLDSVNEMDACTNLTYSWGLLGGLIEEADEATETMDDLVGVMKTAAQLCVVHYYKVPSFKRKCIDSVRGQYSTQWTNATSLAQEAYYQISGGGLLVGSDIEACQNAENGTLSSKCDSIASEVQTNCLTSTPSP